MGPLDHYMLAGAGRWNRVAVTETLGILDRLRNCDDQDRYPDAGASACRTESDCGVHQGGLDRLASR